METLVVAEGHYTTHILSTIHREKGGLHHQMSKFKFLQFLLKTIF